MPCQRVLAPVTGADPPQAAETAAARVPPGWSPAPARSRSPCDGPARTCRYVRLLTERRLSGSFSAYRSLPNTCSCLRASVRGFQRAEQPAMVTTWPTTCRVHVHFAGVRQSVWDCRELAHSQVSALDRGWRLACAVPSPPLPRPMHRVTCRSRTRLHARSQVLAMHPAWQTRS